MATTKWEIAIVVIGLLVAVALTLTIRNGYLTADSAKTTIPVLIVTIAALTLRWGYRSWRLKYMTDEWNERVKFLLNYAEFMDADANASYVESFKNEKAIQYELVARFCLSYLDDLYHLGCNEELGGWISGSIELFGKRHRQWFLDHQVAYSPAFRKFLIKELNVG